MAKISVDYNTIEATAASIDRYIDAHRRNMRDMEAELVLLGNCWQGSDYQQALFQWREMSSNISASGRLLQGLEDQAKLLRWSVKRYKTVQNMAISRAKRLKR